MSIRERLKQKILTNKEELKTQGKLVFIGETGIQSPRINQEMGMSSTHAFKCKKCRNIWTFAVNEIEIECCGVIYRRN